MKMNRISRNGKAMAEGEVLCSHLRSRFNSNKNWLCAIVGPTGSGKSYVSMRIAELWYQNKFHEPFPLENICFDLKTLALRLRNGNLRKGEMLIFEEAGVNINNLEFQNKIQRIFQQVMQTFRSKNIGIIFNLPSIGFMGKGTRVLLHGLFQTKGIDLAEKETVIKPLFVQYNTLYDKSYHKYMRVFINGLRISVSEMRFKKPSDTLLTEYEKKKEAFVHSTMDRLIDEMEVQDKKEENIITKEKEKLTKQQIKEQKDKEIEQMIEEYYLEGHKTLTAIAKAMGTTVGALSQRHALNILLNIKKKYKENIQATPVSHAQTF